MRSLVALFICTAGMLGADVCVGLPSGNAFRLTPHVNGPSFRIVVQSSPAVIEISRCEDGKPIQSLAIVSPQSLDFAQSFHSEDINFDGYLDFAVLVDRGGKWGSEDWWVYDPLTGKFVQNELTRALRALKAAEYTFDAKTHELRTRYLTEPWGCGSTGDRYRIANNRLLRVHQEKPKPSANGCDVVVSDLVNGAMRVTKVRHVSETQP